MKGLTDGLPEAPDCPICGSPTRWVPGGWVCPRDGDTDHEGRCPFCGEEEEWCRCCEEEDEED
jgi:hypothetical protein